MLKGHVTAERFFEQVSIDFVKRHRPTSIRRPPTVEEVANFHREPRSARFRLGSPIQDRFSRRSFFALEKLPIGSILVAKSQELGMAVAHAARDFGRIKPPANLADAASRQRLTPAAVTGVVRLADSWRLTSTEICSLIGDVSERTWFRMKKGEWDGVLSQDSLTRISALVGIFKGLRLLFSEQLADEWIRLPNKGPLYGGRRPLDIMIEGGIPKLLQVRRHIDALRGGL